MRFEAGLRAAAVRYASVSTGVRGPRVPRTRAEKATDGAGGSGYTNRPARLLASDLPLQNACSLPLSPSPLGSRSVSQVMTWMPPEGSPIQRHPRMASATTGPTLQRSRPRTRMSCSIAESWSLADSPTRNSNAVRRSGLAAHLAEQIHGLSSPGMGKPQRARLPALDVADGTRTTGLNSGMIARPESSWPRRCTAWSLPRRSPRPILTPVQGPMTRPHAARGGEAPTHCVTGAATGGPSPPAIRRAA